MSKTAAKIVVWILPVLMALVWIVPYIYMLLASFKSDIDMMLGGFTLDNLTLETYIDVIGNTTVAPIGTWFLNSVIVSVSASVMYAVVVLLAAYGYSRLKFRGRDLLFMCLMLSMTIPGIINIVPQYQIMTSLNLKNNLLAVILPSVGGMSGLFLMKQFMMRLPRSLDEAAELDGAGRITILFQILLPQVIPALVIVMLFCFLGVWNDFLWPSVILDDYRSSTLTSGFYILTGVYDAEQASLMAASIVSSLPIIAIYLVFQKYLFQGISISSGIKE